MSKIIYFFLIGQEEIDMGNTEAKQFTTANTEMVEEKKVLNHPVVSQEEIDKLVKQGEEIEKESRKADRKIMEFRLAYEELQKNGQ